MKIDKERRDQILALRASGLTYRQISKELNCNINLVGFYCNSKRYNPIERALMEERKAEADKEYEVVVCQIVKECHNINQVCKALGKRGTTAEYELIRRIIEKYNIDTSHFVTDCRRKTVNKLNMDDVFNEHSLFKDYSRLKTLLINRMGREEKCECCGLTVWNGVKIPLQTHHINGIKSDNRLENLQLLCPNCHAATDTYCGKNNKVDRNYIYTEKVCKECGKTFLRKDNQREFCSEECYNKSRQRKYRLYSENVNADDIIKAFKEIGSFTGTAKKFGVTDNAVRKWCVKFGLPTKTREMREYISSQNAT